uniref:Putative polysaccharide deacetylase n=1 Tax=viral metagenome TaxID=1070528 RepID=A0A6M3KAS3_9ZZZZ
MTGVLIIALHSIEKQTQVRFETSTENFEWILQMLSERGYKSITLGQFYNFTKGLGVLPEKPVIITSDDGYESIYTNALPLVKKYGFSMTLFIALEYIAQIEKTRVVMSVNRMPPRRMLLWDEVKELSENGFDIQSHGVNHCNFTDLNLEDSVWNLKGVKVIIENKTGKECNFHAWCNGVVDNRLFDKMSELGYKGFLKYSGGIENTDTVDWKNVSRVYIEDTILHPTNSVPEMSRELIENRLFVKGVGDK